MLSLREAKDAAKGLGLTNAELRRLKSQFDSIDISGDGDIDAEELLEALQERPTPLTDAIFKLIDLVGVSPIANARVARRFICDARAAQDGNGRVSFDEFVVCLVTYCLYSREDILQFMFNIFDVDNSGALDDRECVSASCGVSAATCITRALSHAPQVYRAVQGCELLRAHVRGQLRRGDSAV